MSKSKSVQKLKPIARFTPEVVVEGSLIDTATRSMLVLLEMANIKCEYNPTPVDEDPSLCDVKIGKRRMCGGSVFFATVLMKDFPKELAPLFPPAMIDEIDQKIKWYTNMTRQCVQAIFRGANGNPADFKIPIGFDPANI